MARTRKDHPASGPPGTVGSGLRQEEDKERNLSNIEIVALAVYSLGGESRYIDTEDVAMRANALAPGRFTWAKYRDQVNIHTIMTHLWDAKSDRKGGLLIGSEKEGWMLTERGMALVRNRADALKGVKSAGPKLTAGEKQWKRGERARLLRSAAYRKHNSSGAGAVTREEAEAFFRLNDYVVGDARERKLIRILNAFGDDETLGPVVKILAEKVRGDGRHA